VPPDAANGLLQFFLTRQLFMESVVIVNGAVAELIVIESGCVSD
jgi:hypothetical protein